MMLWCDRNLLAFLLLLPLGKYIPVHHQVVSPIWIVIVTLGSQAWLATQTGVSGNIIMTASAAGGALLGAASSLLLCGAYLLASRFPAMYVQVCTLCQWQATYQRLASYHTSSISTGAPASSQCTYYASQLGTMHSTKAVAT